MAKVTLTEDERAAIVNALTEKASDDEKRADELETNGPYAWSSEQQEGVKRLAFTFRTQADNGRKLAEKIETADTVELC